MRVRLVSFNQINIGGRTKLEMSQYIQHSLFLVISYCIHRLTRGHNHIIWLLSQHQPGQIGMHYLLTSSNHNACHRGLSPCQISRTIVYDCMKTKGTHQFSYEFPSFSKCLCTFFTIMLHAQQKISVQTTFVPECIILNQYYFFLLQPER